MLFIRLTALILASNLLAETTYAHGGNHTHLDFGAYALHLLTQPDHIAFVVLTAVLAVAVAWLFVSKRKRGAR